MPFPGAVVPGTAFSLNYDMFGIEPIDRNIVFGPMYHANPFAAVHASLFDGHLVILHEKFKAAQVVESIRRHRPQYITLAPTMMKRLLEVDGIEDVDWSCFHIVLHGTAPCPPWLKRRWIELVGAERLWEIFASTELVGSIVVRGDEWLERPGTVGRPTAITELKILDENGDEVPVGEVGEIFMRIRGTTAPIFDYLGPDRPRVTPDGFASAGDLGSVDEDGYVYSADRRKDLIITGGVNVVPAEVEAALGEHPGVADVAVVGLPDEDWGHRVHAIVVPADPVNPPSAEELETHCRERLARYKVPKSFELIDELPRTDMFKIRRSALAAERR
jgi:bile acid-coenzyme A ligase